jgi:hypothetical protein
VTDAAVHPETVQAKAAVSYGASEFDREAHRHLLYLAQARRRESAIRGRAMALAGSESAAAAVRSAFSALVPDAQEREHGPVFPRAWRGH